MRRRIHIFTSLAISAALIVGAVAVGHNVWYYDGADHRYTPQWVWYLVAGMVILAALSPILTWPRPWRQWRLRHPSSS